MIVLDTETTGLPEPKAAGLDAQPRIIEIAAIKLSDFDLSEKARLELRFNPQRLIPAEVTKITGLTAEDVKNSPLFISRLPSLCSFFLGEATMVAHNMPFDKEMIANELIRIGKEFSFPWPPQQICTVELTHHIENRRLHMKELYKLATGRELDQKHRAMADTEALVEIVRWCREQGLL